MKNKNLIIGALMVGGIAYLFLRKKKSGTTTNAVATKEVLAQDGESEQSEESGAMGGGGGGGAMSSGGGGGMSSDVGVSSGTSNGAILGVGNVLVTNSSGVGVGRPMNPTLSTIPSYKPKPTLSTIPSYKPKPTISSIPSYKPKPTFQTSPISLPKTPQGILKGAVLGKSNFLTFDGSFRQSASHFFDGNID
jgi:hypothetical protein